MYLTIDDPFSHIMYPTNICGQSTSNYMAVLRRSRIASELQRVFCASSSRPPKKYVAGHMQVEVQMTNEINQTNVDVL